MRGLDGSGIGSVGPGTTEPEQQPRAGLFNV